MRPLGTALLILGLLVGGLVGLGLLTGVAIPGVPWLVAVGLVKLTVLASLGLLGAGAALHRLAKGSEDRDRLGRGPPE